MTNYERYIAYLNKLKQPHVNAVRVDWLNPDGTVAYEITESAIQGGNINVQFQSGQRRTATLTLDNASGKFNVNPDKMWIGQTIRISMGVYLDDDMADPYLIPQGVFVLASPVDQTYNPDTKTVTMSLADKWSVLTRTLDGIYQINAGDNLYDAVRGLLQLDQGNGTPLDPVAPILPSYYIGKTERISYTRPVQTIDASGAQITGFETYYRNVPIIEAPYTQRIDASGTFADIVTTVSEMLIADVGYDNVGQLCIEPANTDQLESEYPVVFAFTTSGRELLGLSYSFPIGDVYNDIRITGGTFDGKLATGHAQNNNPSDGTSVGRIGRHTYFENKSGYTSQYCQEYAEYLLARKCKLLANTTISCIPLYHLTDSHNVVTIEHDDNVTKYRVTGYSLPIGQTGSMNISAVKIAN